MKSSVLSMLLASTIMGAAASGGGPPVGGGATEVVLADSAVTTVGVGTGGTGIHDSVAYPATVSAGQLLIAIAAFNGGYIDPGTGGSTRKLEQSNGWTPIHDENPGTIRHACTVYYKIATGAEGGTTETWTTTNNTTPTDVNGTFVILAYDGADTTYWLDNWRGSNATSGTTLTAPSAYGSYAGGQELRIFTGQGSSLTDTPGSLVDPVYASGGTEKVLVGLVAASGGGQTGAYAVAMGSSNDWTAITLCIKPEDGGGDHSSVLYRSEAGFTESGALETAGTEAVLPAAQGTWYMRFECLPSTHFAGYPTYIEARSGATVAAKFAANTSLAIVGPDNDAANRWINTNQFSNAQERVYLEVELNNATASPCRGFIRTALQSNNHPGIGFTLFSNDTTTAGATTFDRLVFFNGSDTGNSVYSRVLVTSESLI